MAPDDDLRREVYESAYSDLDFDDDSSYDVADDRDGGFDWY